jgi:hypothetical protein
VVILGSVLCAVGVSSGFAPPDTDPDGASVPAVPEEGWCPPPSVTLRTVGWRRPLGSREEARVPGGFGWHRRQLAPSARRYCTGLLTGRSFPVHLYVQEEPDGYEGSPKGAAAVIER